MIVKNVRMSYGWMLGIVQEAANKHLIKNKPSKRTKWLSEETVNIAKKQRLAKAEGNHERVKELNASFQREARRAKEKFYNDHCNMIEVSNSKENTRELFKTIRDITGTFTPRIGIVKDKQGKDLREEDEVKARLKEYTEDLHRCDTTISEEFEARDFTREPSISESQVIRAMKEVANGKAPGIDNIPIELFKEGGDEAIVMIAKICDRIWDTAKWPRQWKQSIYISIPKKEIHVHVKTIQPFLLLCMLVKYFLK